MFFFAHPRPHHTKMQTPLHILQALPICFQGQELPVSTWEEIRQKLSLNKRTASNAIVIQEDPTEEKARDGNEQSTWYQGVLTRVVWQGLHRRLESKRVTLRQHFGGQTIAVRDYDATKEYLPPTLHLRTKKARQYPLALLLLLCRTRHPGLATLPEEILQLILDHYSSNLLINGSYMNYKFVIEGGALPP